MKGLTVVCALVITYIRTSISLQCLHCNGVISPLLCERIKVCDSQEVCMTERYITRNEEQLYKLGCYPRTTCRNVDYGHPVIGSPHFVTNLDPEDLLQCTRCCETDVCNKQTCVNTDDIIQHGPICLNCHQTHDPGTCSFVRTCEKNQVCSLHEERRLGISFYSASCAIYSDCISSPTNIFGKRKRLTEKQSMCCSSDLCNRNLGGYKGLIKDCLDAKNKGHNQSGVYTIYPDGRSSVKTYCDMTTDGGGWTVLITRRIGDSFQGNRSWSEFKVGFGSPNGSYWIGNENIHLLTTNRPSTVYFMLDHINGTNFYAKYDGFWVGGESDGYRLHFNGTSYRGTAGDSFYVSKHHGDNLDGAQFSTYDRDNDGSLKYHYAGPIYESGWWYNDDCAVQLTAEYGARTNRWYLNLNVDTLRMSKMMIKFNM